MALWATNASWASYRPATLETALRTAPRLYVADRDTHPAVKRPMKETNEPDTKYPVVSEADLTTVRPSGPRDIVDMRLVERVWATRPQEVSVDTVRPALSNALNTATAFLRRNASRVADAFKLMFDDR